MPRSSSKIKFVPNIKIDKNMRDYSNDPYFIKKKEDAMDFMKKHPFIEEEIRKIREQRSTDLNS